MAKKKKTQLKPVARGFATTSQPKKPVPEEENVIQESGALSTTEYLAATMDNGDASRGKAVSGNVSGAAEVIAVDEFDPEKAEEQSLQNLVDRIQDRTEKEIARAVKLVETDRRFVKGLPRLELDEVYVDRINNLLLEAPQEDNGQPVLVGPEDKFIGKLGVTYGVLRRLGFSEDRTIECLKSIKGIELEEAYEWLYLHCSNEELDALDSNSTADPMESGTPRKLRPNGHDGPRTPKMPAQFLAAPRSSHRKATFQFDANASEFVPQARHKHSLVTSRNSTSPLITSSEGSDSDDADNPNVLYSKLMAKLDRLTVFRRPGDATDASIIPRLRSGIQSAKDHYFFDQKEAERLYSIRRKVAESDAVQHRANDAFTLQPAPKARGNGDQTSVSLPPQPSVSSAASSDIFDSESDGPGLLDLLQEMPQTEISQDGAIVQIRNFALPKHWSGKTPKTLLKETVHKVDRYAIMNGAWMILLAMTTRRPSNLWRPLPYTTSLTHVQRASLLQRKVSIPSSDYSLQFIVISGMNLRQLAKMLMTSSTELPGRSFERLLSPN
jgi:ATP-dependent RNA helicase DHX29